MKQLDHMIDGPTGAPVMVLGPSLGTDAGLFDPQVEALADRYRILRFNLPGHGGAPTPAGPNTVAHLAEGVLSLLDHHGIGRCHYAGVSLGGAIGLQLALDHPDRLLSLTVLASAARFADPASWPARAATVRAQGTEAMVASRPGTWYTHAFARAHPQQAGRLLTMLRQTTAEGYAECCEAIGVFDVRARLNEIHTPTLALADADDPVTPPETLRQIADAIPGAEMVIVPESAHLLNVERPSLVTTHIAAHLAATTPGGEPSHG